MISGPASEQDELNRAVEAADRAGSIVTEHVRSIIDAAQARAADIERNANDQAEELRQEAEKAARRVLERIDAIEGHLGTLVSGLRRDVETLSREVHRRT